MSGNGAWYGGDEPTAEQPLVPRPLVARPVVPQPRTSTDDVPPTDLPPPFPASMYEEPETATPVTPAPPGPAPLGMPGPGAYTPGPGAYTPAPSAYTPPPGTYVPDQAVPGQGVPGQGVPGQAVPGGVTESPTTTIPRINPGTNSVQLNAIEVTTDSSEPPAAEPPPPAPVREPRNRRDLSAAIAIAIVILMVLCIGAVGSSFQVLTQASETFETGNCVAPDRDGRLPYEHVECTDPAFTHTVLGVLDRDSDRPCRSIPGASTLFSTNAKVICLGVKGVNTSTAINAAREGDCVNMDGGGAVRVECRDPGAKFQVIKRLTDVPEGTTGPCDGVVGLQQTYQWNWISTDPVDRNDKSVDVVLCLGPSQSAIDAEAAAREAQSTCRFLTDAEVSATVSAATSKTYTVSKREDDGTRCSYQFSKSSEVVRVAFFSGAKLDPGRNSEKLTIEGLRASWVPGRNDRSLGVELPSGTIYIKVQLSGVGDATSRKLAIETFKSARARIA